MRRLDPYVQLYRLAFQRQLLPARHDHAPFQHVLSTLRCLASMIESQARLEARAAAFHSLNIGMHRPRPSLGRRRRLVLQSQTRELEVGSAAQASHALQRHVQRLLEQGQLEVALSHLSTGKSVREGVEMGRMQGGLQPPLAGL